MLYQANGGKSHLGTSRRFFISKLEWTHNCGKESFRPDPLSVFLWNCVKQAHVAGLKVAECVLRGWEAGSSLVLYNSPPSIRTGGF